MCKRILFSTTGLFVLGALVFGHSAASYVRTGWSRVAESVQQSVPVDFEIDRARKMVKDLVPDIQRNMHVIAKEEVEVDRLEDQIADSQQKLERDRADLLRLKEDAASGRPTFTYGERSYTLGQVKLDLANRFERFKTADATVTSLREIHEAREKSLEAARQKLEGMLAAKRQLEVDVENLEARRKMVEVAQSTSNYQFDDSQLGRVKELVSDLRTRLEVAEKMVNAESNFHDEIPLDQASPEGIVDQVSDYFGPGAAKGEQAAGKTAADKTPGKSVEPAAQISPAKAVAAEPNKVAQALK